MPKKVVKAAQPAEEPDVAEEAAALERSDRAEAKESSEQDGLSTISEEESSQSSSLEDPKRADNIAALVKYGFTSDDAMALGYMFTRSSSASELTAAQAAQLTSARAIKVDKEALRASLGPHLKSERFEYTLVKSLLEMHNMKFPGGNFSAMLHLTLEGILQLKGVPIAAATNQSAKFQIRKRPAAGAGGGGVTERSVHDLSAMVPRHLLTNKLTARPKVDLQEEELLLIGELTSFGFGCLQGLEVLLPNAITFNLEMLHVEQRFLFDTIKTIAAIAVEDNITWGQALQAKLAGILQHEYDDPKQRPTVLSRYAVEMKSFFLTDGVQAYELFKECFKESLVCKSDNVAVASYFSWSYDLGKSATTNAAELEMLREAQRKTLYEPYAPVLADMFICGIFIGSFLQQDLFTVGHEISAVQGFRELLHAEPAILENWPRLRSEIEKLQQGPCFRGHVTGAAVADAFVAQKVSPPKHQKQSKQTKPRPASASVPAEAPSATVSKDFKFAPATEHKKSASSSKESTQLKLTRYFEALSAVREFFGILDVPLSKFLEPVAVNGVNTHRWKLEAFKNHSGAGGRPDRSAKPRPLFIPADMIATAQKLQRAGTLARICSSLYKVKNARLEGDASFIEEIHQHARVVASILVADEVEPTEDEYANMLAEETAARPQPAPTRRAAAAALADGVRALLVDSVESEDSGDDDVSAVTEGTLNFTTVFSHMAIADTAAEDKPPAPAEATSKIADAKKGKANAHGKSKGQRRGRGRQIPTVARETAAAAKDRAGAAAAAPGADP